MANYDASIRVNTKVSTADLLKVEHEFDKITIQLHELYQLKEKLEKAGVSKQSEEWKSLMTQIEPLETKYDGMKAELEAMQKASEKALKPLKDMKKRLFGIAAGTFVFGMITKGFNAVISAAREGFQNLVQYSKEYNSAMSAMQSEAVQFKNGLAAAFEPIATTVIPYITMFLSWTNKAVEAIAKLIAIMNGKSTYTRAKNQIIDYAKSLDTAAKSAKNALAPFDELNVLQKNESTSAQSGELTGADAFETVVLTETDMEMYDLVKEKIQDILKLLFGVGLIMDVLGKGGRLAGLVGDLMLIIGLVEFVKNYMEAWNNEITFENLKGMLKGLAMGIIGISILFGPIAAGLALIIGGIALVVLAIKDMNENGINAQNCLTLLIGVVGALVGIFVVFGGTAALIVGAVVAVIAVFAALITIAGNGEEAIATLKSMCGNFANFFKKLFTGDILGALECLNNGCKDLLNLLIIIVESAINCVIKGTNWLIDKINGIKIDAPDWVTKLTGVTAVGFNLPHIPEQHLPRLADGAVIQGGKPFAAILGDQHFGQTNIETPLATMVEAFKQAMTETEGVGGQYTFIAQLDGRVIFKETVKRNKMHYKATGKSAYSI